MFIGQQVAQIVRSKGTNNQKFMHFLAWIESIKQNQIRLNEQIEAAENITKWLEKRPKLEKFTVCSEPMLCKETPFAWNLIGNKKD